MRSPLRSLLTPFYFVVALSAVAVAPGVAKAQAADGEEAVEQRCEDGPGNKDWMLSLGGTLLGTLAVGAMGMQTLSRSLAAGGHRQGSANTAGLGLGALVGGGVGAGVVAASGCGLMNGPGFIGLAVGAIGFATLAFSIATGRSR